MDCKRAVRVMLERVEFEIDDCAFKSIELGMFSYYYPFPSSESGFFNRRRMKRSTLSFVGC